MPNKSGCPLETPLPDGWTLCHSIALGAAIPIFLIALLVLLGNLIWLFT